MGDHGAVVVLAGGIAATTQVPAPVALVAMAVGAEVSGRGRRATAWAATAALAPLAALGASALALGPGVLVRLGLTSPLPRLAAVGVGLAAAAVIGREAARRRSLGLVVLAGLAAGTGVADGWTSTFHTPGAHLVGLAALFALVELAALGVADDPFWGRPARVVAGAVEVLAAAITTVGGLVAVHVLADRWADETGLLTRPAILAAGGLALVAWFVADLRRREPDAAPLGIALLVGAGWAPATVALAVTALVSVAAGLGSPLAVGITAVAMAALLVVAGRDGADVMALLLVIPAPFTAGHHPAVAAAMALAGALLLAAVTVIHAPLARLDAQVEAAWLLALSTVLPVVAAAIATFGHVDVLPAAASAVLVLWAASLVLEVAGDDPRFRGIALVPRAAALLSLLTAPELTAAGLAALSGLLAGLALADALGRRRPSMAVQTAALAPLTLGMAVLAAGGTNAVAAITVIGVAVIATAADDLVPGVLAHRHRGSPRSAPPSWR